MSTSRLLECLDRVALMVVRLKAASSCAPRAMTQILPAAQIGQSVACRHLCRLDQRRNIKT